MSDGRYLLKQALLSSEQKQFSDALNYIDQALVAFAQAQDLDGYAETYSMKFHIFKHLRIYSDFEGYHYSALSCALLGAQIAQEHQLQRTYVMQTNAAKALDQDGQTAEAIQYYQAALNSIQINNQARKAESADIQNHLDALLIATGDLEAENRILKNIEVIQSSFDISTYERDVWTSGAYLRLFKALKSSNPTKANQYLESAKQIIESNQELVIRKDQLLKLSEL